VISEFPNAMDRLNLESPETISVFADEERLRMVLRNLISNAIKYSSEEVVVRLEKQNESLLISVVNHGTISSEELEKIFEPFYRTDKSRERIGKDAANQSSEYRHIKRGDGFGLGLYLCKKIVDAHNGTIKAESTYGITTFTVSIT
jgi:signal transduction histidine kinase